MLWVIWTMVRILQVFVVMVVLFICYMQFLFLGGWVHPGEYASSGKLKICLSIALFKVLCMIFNSLTNFFHSAVAADDPALLKSTIISMVSLTILYILTYISVHFSNVIFWPEIYF